MKRFFCPKENIKSDQIIITDKEEIHHISSVMRQKEADTINIFDAEGNEYRCKISEVSNDKIVACISGRNKPVKKRNYLTLACAIPKKSKFDSIVERCTELGVDKIIPLITERTIIKLNEDQKANKVSRWRRIAISACKQSGRKALTDITEAKSFKDVLKEVKNYDVAILPCLQQRRKNLRDVFPNFKGRRIIVFIGPEGDFTNEEISEAKRCSCQLVSLGANTLKVETAAVYVASVFSYIFNSNE